MSKKLKGTMKSLKKRDPKPEDSQEVIVLKQGETLPPWLPARGGEIIVVHSRNARGSIGRCERFAANDVKSGSEYDAEYASACLALYQAAYEEV